MNNFKKISLLEIAIIISFIVDVCLWIYFSIPIYKGGFDYVVRTDLRTDTTCLGICITLFLAIIMSIRIGRRETTNI